MGNYNHSIIMTVGTYDEEYFRMINIKVEIISGKFPIKALPEFMRVRNGSTLINSFMTFISGNRKKMSGHFTTDGFLSISGNSNIEFGYGEEIMDTIENIDINASILPLDPVLASVSAPNADNAWLQSIA